MGPYGTLSAVMGTGAGAGATAGAAAGATGALAGASSAIPWFGAGLAGANMLAQGLSSLWSYGQQSALVGRQYTFNTQLQALQQYYNLQNYRQTDAYQRKLLADSPSINKNALINAGISPASMLGSFVPAGSNVHAGSTGAPGVGLGSASAPKLELLGSLESFARTLNSLKDLEVKDSVKDLNESQSSFNEQKVTESQEYVKLMQITEGKTEADMDLARKEIEVKAKSLEVMDSQILLNAQKAYESLNNVDIAWKELDLQTRSTYAQIELFKTQGKLNEANASQAYKCIARMDSEITLMYKQGVLTEQQAELCKAQAYSVRAQGDLTTFDYNVKKTIGYDQMADWQKKNFDANLEHIHSQIRLNGAYSTQAYAQTIELSTRAVKNSAEAFKAGTEGAKNIKNMATPAGLLGLD